jgi:hypothetical protein
MKFQGRAIVGGITRLARNQGVPRRKTVAGSLHPVSDLLAPRTPELLVPHTL